MEQITEQQLRELIKFDQGTRKEWKLRSCSICGAPLCYQFYSDGLVTFDSNCDCSSYWTEPRRSSLEEIVETLNRQPPEVRACMWANLRVIGAESTP